MKHTKSKTKILIGRKDYADFPLLELSRIKVKIDTGAYTSSINCYFAEETESEGNKVLVCKFLAPSHAKYSGKEFYFANYKQKEVKSSNGISEKRYLIKTQIKIFNKLLPIELTLTKRSSMKNDVLLGRKFLKKRFVVDSSETNLSRKGVVKTISINENNSIIS